MKELIEYIVRALVDAPDDVEVVVKSEDEHAYELHVNADDRGKVIGRKGRTAHAIRMVLAAAAKEDAPRPSLDIVD